MAKEENLPRKQWLRKFINVLKTNKYLALKKASEKEKANKLLNLIGEN